MAPRRKLTDADILDSFRTVTNWSDAEVLHYESCGECDPFASVVCEAHPAAVKEREEAEDDAYIAEHGNDDLETGHTRDPEGDEAAHA
jgi:hypothetical protein